MVGICVCYVIQQGRGQPRVQLDRAGKFFWQLMHSEPMGISMVYSYVAEFG